TGHESVVIAEWPQAENARADAAAEATVAELQRIVTEVRRFRGDQGVKPGQRVPARIIEETGSVVADHEDAFRSLTRLDRPGEAFSPTARVVVGAVTVELDLSDAVDVEAERRRLTKDLANERKALEQANRKLSNEQFLAKAPEAEVAKVRRRRSDAEADIARLEAQLAQLPTT